MKATHTEEPDRGERASAIGKVVAVVEMLATENRVSNIARAVQLPTSTVHRILQELVKVGWARDDDVHSYMLGVRLLAITARADNSAYLVRVGLPILRKLRDATDRTVHLSVRQSDEMIYAAKLEGHRAYQMRSHVGLSIPLHCTATGKALLAALSVDEVQAIVARTGLPRHTEHTITDLDMFLEHLEAVRRQGFALDEEENEASVRCVGAVVIGQRGIPIAGVSVSSLSFDVDDALMRRYAELVVAAADEISRALGATPLSVADSTRRVGKTVGGHAASECASDI